MLTRIFRPTFLLVFDITNLELGTYFSIYGMIAIASYFFGGPLADRFPARNLMGIALWSTALGGLLMAFLPIGSILKYLYAFWGFTTIFMFWAALIKTTRALGGSMHQGRTFGIVEGGRGLTSAIIGTLALALFYFFMPEQSSEDLTALRLSSFKWVILLVSIAVALVGVIVWKFIPKHMADNDQLNHLPRIEEIKSILLNKTVWMQALIIICAYSGYKITDDISLYALEVLHYNEVDAAAFGTTALWLRPVFAVLAGFLADKFQGSKVIIWCFTSMTIAGFLIASSLLHSYWIMMLILFLSTLAGIYGLRGIYFATMKEANIPLIYTGTAVGVISVLGYTPDVFISPWMGYLLDSNPGLLGHQYVIYTLVFFSIIGLITSIIYNHKLKRLNRNRFSTSDPQLLD